MTMPMAPIIEGRAALLIIDVQNGIVGPAQATSKPEFHATASARVIPNIRRLLNAFRAARLEMIYTVIDDLTQNGAATAAPTTSSPASISPSASGKRASST
jgi:nicotinamidase-related amidase